ncbi:MAG: glycosyltransferase family 4 protein [Bacteroidales bacterium]|nr:glycosyltransferase family 4 protein [Bacteroidales bacterium]
MKILLINTSEQTGGAAVACKRLMRALQKSDVEVKMLVRDKSTDDADVIAANSGKVAFWMNKFRFAFERLVIYIGKGLSLDNLFAVSIANTGIRISKLPAVKEADILHIHWINQGFLSLSEIKRLSKLGKPIVWTMHDMWPATAICHHSRDCENYQRECKECYFLETRSENDLSNKVFYKKRRIWQQANIEFVTCSKWLERRTKLSVLINPKNVRAIPNPLDIDFYKPSDKAKARERFGLPVNKKLLLYGAANVTDKRKGIDYYVNGCKILAEKYPDTNNEIELVFFGKSKENIDSLFPFPIHQIGYLTNNEAIRDLYCAVDLFVTPSLEENLPNTIMESLACGTPATGFYVGGIPEMIEHKQNGFLSIYKSAENLAEGIHWCLWEADYKVLSSNARKKVEDCYSESYVAKEYVHLYSQLLAKKKR